MSYHHPHCLVHQHGPCDCGLREFLDDPNVRQMEIITDEGKQEIVVTGKTESLGRILKERNT